MISGTVYGVVLNDRAERETLGSALEAPPHGAAPRAPVLYIKPRTCITVGSAPVPVPLDLPEVQVAATMALLFNHHGAPGAACLALDVCEPHASYYRPAIRERCRDGFLPLGNFGPMPAECDTPVIATRVNGREVHRWSLTRLVRAVPQLLADVGAFMTLGPGDVLLVGLAGDAPRATRGDAVEVEMAGLPTLRTALVAEAAA